jgi:hypothetical protein
MSDTSQNNTGGLWDEQPRLPTLTPLDNPQRVAAAMATSARIANQVAVQEQIRALTRTRNAAEHDGGDPTDGPDPDTVRVRIQWAETTRYEADVYVDPWASEASILAGLAALEAGQRRVMTALESDNRLVSVIDLDGDGHIDAYELSTSAAQVDDWERVADGIDEGITGSPSWPQLHAALRNAADGGWAVATELPVLAAALPLPDHDPAGELYYRLLNARVVEVSTDDSAANGEQQPPRHDEPLTYARDTPPPASPGR